MILVLCRWPAGCDKPAGSRTNHCKRHSKKRYDAGLRIIRFIPDTNPAREHAREYVRRGGSTRALGARAGIAHTTIRRLLSGTTSKIDETVAARVLAVPMRPSEVGCRRRLDALAADGWPGRIVADAMGMPLDTVWAARRRGRFTDGIAWALVAVFDRWRDTNGPDQRTASLAAHRGQLPGWAWDGVDIDDPAAVPLGPGPLGRPADTALFYPASYYYARTGIWPNEGAG